MGKKSTVQYQESPQQDDEDMLMIPTLYDASGNVVEGPRLLKDIGNKRRRHEEELEEEQPEEREESSAEEEELRPKKRKKSNKGKEEDTPKKKSSKSPAKSPRKKKELYDENPKVIKPEIFDITDEEQKDAMFQHIKENGYVVIGNVLNKEQVSKAIASFWRWCEGLKTGVDRNDPETWSNENWPDTFSSGIISRYGIGQSSFLWNLRVWCKPVFETLWFEGMGVEKQGLVVSFDGAEVFRPSGNPKWKTKGGNYFTSQNSQRRGFQSIQGIVNLIETNKETGGFVVLPGSHKSHKKFFRENESYEKIKDENVPLTKEAVEWFGIDPVMLRVPAGSIILWDSRLVHSSSPGVAKSLNKTELSHLAAYVSMIPASSVDKSVIEERKNAIKEGITTNHWANEFTPTKPPRFSRKGKPIEEFPIIGKMTEEMKALVTGKLLEQDEE